MNIQQLKNNFCGIFNFEQNNLGRHLHEDWTVDFKKRVSLKPSGNDERKMSLERPRTLIPHNEGSIKVDIFCDCEADYLDLMQNLEDEITPSAAKSPLPCPNTLLIKKEMHKHAGHLRAKPPLLSRSITPAKLLNKEKPREKSNKHIIDFEFSSISESEKFFDDCSQVFGGWDSESLSNKSTVRLRLNEILASDSELSYGGEEGAKAHAEVNDVPILRAHSCSEGRSECANIRPKWNSDTEDILEEVRFLEAGASEPSYSVQSFRIIESSYGSNKAINLAAPNKIYGEASIETSPSKECSEGKNYGPN